jgi:subtilisin family serine protease
MLFMGVKGISVSDARTENSMTRMVTRNGWRWAMAVLCGIWIQGCGPTAPLDDTPTDNASVTDFDFPEDADPVIAALSFAPDELLVQPLPGADPQALKTLYAGAGVTLIDEMADIDLTVLRIPAGKLGETAAKLAVSGLLETIQKNYQYSTQTVPNDPIYTRETHLPQIHAEQAWDLSVGSPDIVIGIVDTGVDPDHPDLVDKIIDGWNVYDGNARFDDVFGHGTQVAGVAAATSNNAVGLTGVAWESPILAVCVGNENGLSSSQNIAAGILWAAGHGAKVINVSFAPLWSDKVVKAAVQQAFHRGSLVMIAAGNAGGMNSAVGFDEAVFVGAVTADNTIASFSDRGPFVDVVAPGTGIRSTTFDGDYGMANGTSFAAPIVSGVAALAWAVNPELRPITIKEAIVGSVVDLGATGKDTKFGHGAVDAAAAVAAAKAAFEPADTTPPSVRVSKPVTGQSLSGKATAAVTVMDRYGVADVVLAVDGAPFATDTRSPYSFVIDTTAYSAGSHELSFVATDSSGNASPPQTVQVSFSGVSTASTGRNGTIRFTTPADGSSVTGNVTIKAAVSDADGLAVIEWFVDGESVFVAPLSGDSSGVSYVWRSASSAAGSHTITVAATDTAGNQTRGSLYLTRR